MTRGIISGILACFLLAPTVFGKVAAAGAKVKVIVDVVRLRTETGAEGDVVASAYGGDVLEVLKVMDPWLRVGTRGGREGWILKGYVKVVRTGGKVEEEEKKRGEAEPAMEKGEEKQRGEGISKRKRKGKKPASAGEEAALSLREEAERRLDAPGEGVSGEEKREDELEEEIRREEPLEETPDTAVVLAIPRLPAPSTIRRDYEATVIEEIVALVNDKMITKSQMESQSEAIEKFLQLEGGGDSYRRRALKYAKENLLDLLIDRLLLLGRADELRLPRERIYKKLKEDFKERNNIKDDLDLLRVLDKIGWSWEDFRENLLGQYLPEAVIGREVTGRIEVSEGEIREFYEEHIEEFSDPEEIIIREIVIKAGGEDDEKNRERFGRVSELLKSGADFASLAKEYSESYTSSRGGLLGPLRIQELDPAISDLIKTLDPGRFGVMETSYGFHFIQLVERSRGKVKSLEEVEELIRKLIWQKKFQLERKRYIEELREKSFIDIKAGY